MTVTRNEQDERILAAILAAPAAIGREIRPSNTREGISGSKNGWKPS